MRTVRINVELPKPVDHEKKIAAKFKKNPVIDKVKYFQSRYGIVLFESTFDEKKHGSVNSPKLERDLKAAFRKLNYKVR